MLCSVGISKQFNKCFVLWVVSKQYNEGLVVLLVVEAVQ